MSYTEGVKRITIDCDASLALFTGIEGMPGAANPIYGHMYSAVKMTGSRLCGLATSADTKLHVVGVLHSKPQKVGTGGTIALRLGGGVSDFIAGAGGVTAGDGIKLDANGHGVTATPTTDDALVVGFAMLSGAAGSLFPLLFA